MKQYFKLLLLIFTIGSIQKVNSQTEISWLENYEITQLPSLEKDILVLNIKNSGKSKKDCLRKAKEQALFHLLFKGISTNEILAGSNILPRKPIPFLEKFDQNDEKNGLYRFIRKTGFENIIDAEKDENIDGVKNDDQSKTFVSIIKLNTRSLVSQLEELDLKRTFIEELGFKPKILFLPSVLDQIESYLSNTETNTLVAEYNNQFNLVNASLGKSFDVINLFSLKEKLATELTINQEKSAEFKERKIDVISRVFVNDVILLLKQTPERQSGLQATVDPVSLTFVQVGKPILSSEGEKTTKTNLEILQLILTSDSELITEDIFFKLIGQKGKTQDIKVEINCNKRLKKRIDEKIAYAENNLSFLEIIQNYFNANGLKLIPNGKSPYQFINTIENFKSPFLAQREKFVDELSSLVKQKTGFVLDIDFTGNGLVRLELTDMKRLERQRKINSDYQKAISEKSLALHLQFLKEFPDAEYFSEMKDRYNVLITEKVKNKLNEEEYKLILLDEFCTTSRNSVIVSYIESQIPENWAVIIAMDEIKKVIQSINQISQDYSFDYTNTSTYQSLKNRYNELIIDKIKTKLSREEYAALLKDEYCSSSRKSVEISFIESLIPMNWKEINTLKGINDLVKNINSACKENNLTTSLMTNYSYSTSDFSNAGEWTFENLNVSHFNNGDSIYEARTNDEWIRANNEKRPAWCYYNNDEGRTWWDGKLYNYYALSDPRGLVRDGYVIPSIEDYQNLFNILGGKFLAGRKMKAIPLWGEELRENEEFMEGFAAKPSGYRNEKGAFIGNFLHNSGNGEISYSGFWTSTQNGSNATVVYLQQNSDETKVLTNSDKGNGWSVRVMKKKSENDPYFVSSPVIAEIQLKRDQFILKEFQSKNDKESILNFFCNQLKEETNNPSLNTNEVDDLNFYELYHRIWDNLKLVKNGFYPYYEAYKPQPVIYGMEGDYGEGPFLSKIGYNNNIENYQEFDDGTIYKGSIANGIFNGEGILISGEYYLYELPQGAKYQGTFKDGEFIKGKIIYPNGNIYEGECQYYQPHGQGKLTLANGQVKQGNFEGGFLNGFGKISFPDGSVYEGDVVDDQPNGNGTMTLNNKQVKSGKFISGEYQKPFQCKTATIGTQVWMAENLNITKFRNGDPIPEARSKEDWIYAGQNKQPAFCYVNNDPSSATSHGVLYNWYAVNDSRGLAPEGWRVPSHNDIFELRNFTQKHVYDLQNKIEEMRKNGLSSKVIEEEQLKLDKFFLTASCDLGGVRLFSVGQCFEYINSYGEVLKYCGSNKYGFNGKNEYYRDTDGNFVEPSKAEERYQNGATYWSSSFSSNGSWGFVLELEGRSGPLNSYDRYSPREGFYDHWLIDSDGSFRQTINGYPIRCIKN